MKRFIPLIIVILILIGVGIGIWYYQHQKAVKLCKEECNYIAPKEFNESGGNSLSEQYSARHGKDKGDYWLGKNKKFETQDQCIDYCLNVK